MPLEIKRLHLASVTPPGTRAELDRARRESPGLPGLSVIATPGHTNGHQSVVIRGDGGDDLLIGDAAYTPQLYAGPDGQKLPMAHSRGGASRVRRAWRSIRARTRFSACSGLAGPAAPEAASQRPLIPQWRRCCTRAVQVSRSSARIVPSAVARSRAIDDHSYLCALACTFPVHLYGERLMQNSISRKHRCRSEA